MKNTDGQHSVFTHTSTCDDTEKHFNNNIFMMFSFAY